MHYWLDGKGLTELSIDELKRAPQLTPIDALGLHKHLHDWVKGNENEGWELHGLRALQGRDRKAECRIKDPTSGLRANDLALLKHAIEAIDIEHVNLASYDAWFPLFLAICAACGGDMNFFHETVLPWLLRFPGNTEEDMEAKWLQQQTSTIGAEYVYRVAAAEPFNCKEAIDALAPTQETLSALFGDPVSAVGTAASTAAEDNSVVPAVDGNTNGPFPARDTDKYLAERFVEQHRHEWRYAIDQGWVTLKNGLWLPDTTVLYAIGELCSAEGDRYRTRAIAECW
jgi:hypothetical protein